ncbi:unnamed protein product [Vitrella brassicaformis CCMP3155]|uniref:Potassium channel tetramerisation-type BTB domain-containing protein n=1 Tax=Vitrella brassicaformis (strain CCMP3155) TaxID=1169540 RepID=A0A0G4ETE0_VITBC|nr:unnamed protein product [Vitrella brassicaformis CCMP3155]|eukprot:CEM01874.1 unnamed protein product [Vitrella brassicaformis CCMP3155]
MDLPSAIDRDLLSRHGALCAIDRQIVGPLEELEAEQNRIDASYDIDELLSLHGASDGSAASGDDQLDLNVGGRSFTVRRKDVTRPDGSVMASLFGGKWDRRLPRDDKQRIFIDADPRAFEVILSKMSEEGWEEGVDLLKSKARAGLFSGGVCDWIRFWLSPPAAADGEAAHDHIEPPSPAMSAVALPEQLKGLMSVMQRFAKTFAARLAELESERAAKKARYDKVMGEIKAVAPFLRPLSGDESIRSIRVVSEDDEWPDLEDDRRPYVVISTTQSTLQETTSSLRNRFDLYSAPVKRIPADHFSEIVDYARRRRILPDCTPVAPPTTTSDKMDQLLLACDMYGMLKHTYPHILTDHDMHKLARTITYNQPAKLHRLFTSDAHRSSFDKLLQQVGDAQGLVLVVHPQDDDGRVKASHIDGRLIQPPSATSPRTIECPVALFSMRETSTKGLEEVEVPQGEQRVTVAGAGGGRLYIGGGCLVLGMGGDLRRCRLRLKGGDEREFTAQRLEVYQLEVAVDKAAVTSAIDGLIEQKGLLGVIDYQPLRQSASPRQLIRLQYFLENGGDWAASAALLRLAKRYRWIQQLPMQLNEGDVERAGSRATFERRAASLRQWSLVGHRLGRDMALTRTDGGGEMLGREAVVVRASGSKDPPCSFAGDAYQSFSDIVLSRLARTAERRSRMSASRVYPAPSAAHDRIATLIAQPLPLWGSHKVVDTDPHTGDKWRWVLLCGDKAGDAFAAHVWIRLSRPPSTIALYSTEKPRGDGRGAAGNPLAVALAATRMGSDSWLIPAVQKAIATGGGDGGGAGGPVAQRQLPLAQFPTRAAARPPPPVSARPPPPLTQPSSVTVGCIRTAERRSRMSASMVYPASPASSAANDSITALMAQRSPVWGSHTVIDCTDPYTGLTTRRVILCGDKVEAQIKMTTFSGGSSIALHSSEEPHGDGEGVAGSPLAAALAATRMGGDAWLIPGVSEAIATGGGDGGGGGGAGDSVRSERDATGELGSVVGGAVGGGRGS